MFPKLPWRFLSLKLLNLVILFRLIVMLESFKCSVCMFVLTIVVAVDDSCCGGGDDGGGVGGIKSSGDGGMASSCCISR